VVARWWYREKFVAGPLAFYSGATTAHVSRYTPSYIYKPFKISFRTLTNTPIAYMYTNKRIARFRGPYLSKYFITFRFLTYTYLYLPPRGLSAATAAASYLGFILESCRNSTGRYAKLFSRTHIHTTDIICVLVPVSRMIHLTQDTHHWKLP